MKLIPVGKVLYAEVDDEDYLDLVRFNWSVDTSGRKTLYARRNVKLPDGTIKSFKMHRTILKATDPKVFVDHIDGNGLNNQRSNLRLCTDTQNKMNRGRPKHSRAPFKGVSLHDSGLWRSRYRRTLLGYFKDPVQAAIAYDREALARDGEFAYLNFPKERK